MRMNPLPRISEEIREEFGRDVLILGGTTGIGRETARLMTDLGYVVHCPSPEQWDVMDPTIFSERLKDYWEMGHLPRIVVYSAGVNELQWAHSTDPLSFGRTLAVNVAGFAWIIRSLYDVCAAPCRVVAVGSDAASRPMRASATYCSSKAALLMYARCVARELTSAGWSINTVSPGAVADTPMTASVEEQVMKVRGWTRQQAREYENDSGSPLGRKVTKLEVAETIVSVLEMPQAVSGQDFVVNGGR
jgi:NAD(P)-dependent dehydrogenase (short-subunit alcohol dehydrogenase family)